MLHCLGIESSCDDTSCAVVREDGEVLSNIVSSQNALHAEYGGVVPEIASRAHAERIVPVLEQALSEAGVGLGDIGLIAATQGPGLIGSLLVGLETAKGLAYATNTPLAPVNHLVGHLHSVFIGDADKRVGPEFFPYLGLIVSGGHSSLVRCDAPGRYRQVGQTLDDAAGEVYDKVAQMLDLGHPGGPILDKLAANGDPEANAFPRPLLNRDNCDFSFSGLKTAVRVWLDREGREAIAADKARLADLAASFQAAVVDALIEKSKRALAQESLERLAIVGGVACNRGLRAAAAERLAGVDVRIPAPLICTDNAAMIAAVGIALRDNAPESAMTINATASMPLSVA